MVGRTPEDIARSKNFGDIITLFTIFKRKSRQNVSNIFRNSEEL